ncbi:hypothetical protein Dda_8871 [Drechslerella dactyloides]|uniref:F-box domain-containing protein n=1 Tax=Drechslerella dactyloides TaxID=74499 RepID=A0AAD6IQC8_DREDA|nr:hypothetical protein Dda_8871 [Drechslerella dactyloides]
MPTLNSLPNEVLIKIFSDLTFLEQIPIGQVCTHFQALLVRYSPAHYRQHSYTAGYQYLASDKKWLLCDNGYNSSQDLKDPGAWRQKAQDLEKASRWRSLLKCQDPHDGLAELSALYNFPMPGFPGCYPCQRSERLSSDDSLDKPGYPPCTHIFYGREYSPRRMAVYVHDLIPRRLSLLRDVNNPASTEFAVKVDPNSDKVTGYRFSQGRRFDSFDSQTQSQFEYTAKMGITESRHVHLDDLLFRRTLEPTEANGATSVPTDNGQIAVLSVTFVRPENRRHVTIRPREIHGHSKRFDRVPVPENMTLRQFVEKLWKSIRHRLAEENYKMIEPCELRISLPNSTGSNRGIIFDVEVSSAIFVPDYPPVSNGWSPGSDPLYSFTPHNGSPYW